MFMPQMSGISEQMLGKLSLGNYGKNFLKTDEFLKLQSIFIYW